MNFPGIARRAAGLLLALLALAALASVRAETTTTPAASTPFTPVLTVRAGQLLRDGAPCHLIGVNYHDGFLRELPGRPARRTASAGRPVREAFAVLARHEVPFVRFAAGGFYPDEWALYQNQPDDYFARLDRFVAEAEQAGVGLIPSLFWSFFTLPDLVGEPLSAWGEADSATRRFMRRYTTELVTRYRTSRTIWAWEFGNEYMLRADLPKPPDHGTVVPSRGTPATRGEKDRLASRQIREAYIDFARTVRALDPLRPLSTGDALPRSSAWHLRQGKGWASDSPAQFAQVLREDTPPPLDLTSIHAYQRDGSGTRAEHRGLAGQPMHETLRVALQAAKASGQPLFVGEFGADKNSPPEAWRAETEAMFESLVTLRVPLSAIWVFDSLNPGTAHHNFTPENDKAYILELLRSGNRRLAQPTGEPK